MKSQCTDILFFERTLYDVQLANYDPLKDIKAFWKQYPIDLIRDNIIELQSNVNSEQLSGFSLALLKALAAYLMAHVSNVDLSKIGVSEFLKVSKEELKITKKISDFFQRVSPSNTNS